MGRFHATAPLRVHRLDHGRELRSRNDPVPCRRGTAPVVLFFRTSQTPQRLLLNQLVPPVSDCASDMAGRSEFP